MDPQRFEHVVLTIRALGENAARLHRERVRVICLEKQEKGLPVQTHLLARQIREIQPHVVHSRNWGTIEAVVAAWWVRSAAIVHSEHGLESDVNITEPWRRRRFRRLAYTLADRVIAVSHQLKDFHTKRTGFPAHRVSVIHNGVDGRRYYPDAETRASVRRELGVRPGQFCIGSVGNLSPVKDHMTLLRAVESLPGDWRLFIVGKGPQLSNLQAFKDSRPTWKDRVSFLGGSDRVTQLLNALDVYVLPSISEGIANSLLEAMATGLPVVATASGGNPEVVVDGVSGTLFPVGDSACLSDQLSALRASEELRLALGRRALQRVRESFSIESMVRSYGEMYEGLLPTGPSAAKVVA